MKGIDLFDQQYVTTDEVPMCQDSERSLGRKILVLYDSNWAFPKIMVPPNHPF